MKNRNVEQLNKHAISISVSVILLIGCLSSWPVLGQSDPKVYSVSEALADADGDGSIDLLGQKVKISGRATVDNLVFNEQRLSVYIQDEVAGIQVFSGTLEADIQEGDSLIVEGTIQLYYDKPEIITDTVVVVDSPALVPAPKSLNTVINDPEKYLGMLTKGIGVVSQKNASSGYRGLKISVGDSAEQIIEVYISQSHAYKDEFNLELLSIGDEIEITGVVGKFVFQTRDMIINHIMPRTPDDIKTKGFPGKYFKYLIWGGVLSLFFVVGWIFVLRKEVRSRTKELSQALEEKEILMQEIHHRVKNNLAKISALLDLQIAAADHPAVEESLANSKSRINSMALIHDKLYQTQKYRYVRLDTYLKDLVTTIYDTFLHESEHVEVNFDLEPVEFSVDKTVVCGLMINELIVNAYKYAFGENEFGKLTIGLKKKAGSIILTVSDNGPGLPQDFEILVGKGLGSVLIKSFAEQLEAEMKVDSSEKGTTFTFVLKE
ncbi:histidine kinase dimerization/phosphoacceptor domain -containing protein [Gracilimonas halophila]|uniref:histidine kinase n=1 Tax=Gracilimonas halophila TaxID=1834464 RepID=A0ABW5JH82_9BACT